MGKYKHYWLYADGKTVKEITFEQWKEILDKDRNKLQGARLLLRVYPNEMYFRKGRRSMWVKRKQLEKALGLS